MDEKGKNIVIVIVCLIVAIIFGYVIMYIKTPVVVEEEINETKEDINIDNLNFSNYSYDIDGNEENETYAKITDSVVYLTINKNEYTLNNFGNPVSVRIEHAIKDEEYNVIYVLTTKKLYYLSDKEYESAVNSKVNPIFNEAKVDNPTSMAIVSEFDSKTGYRYPTVYLKTKDNKIYVSKFGNDFEEYKR